MHASRLGFALLFAIAASPLAACDLDGLPGFHRANPFARAPIFRGLPAPVAPNAPGTGQPADGQPAERPQDRSQPAAAPEAAQRAWERTDNPGPISSEDKAIFT